MKTVYSASEAMKKLIAGNAEYLKSGAFNGTASAELRDKTAREGQFPYAVIVTCSDSRVIPEAIFSAGIGDIFVIRAAGNVIGTTQLASVEYAVEHLGCRLAVILGHTRCGAVAAALEGPQHGHIAAITNAICEAIGDETDPNKACILNVRRAVKEVSDGLNGVDGLKVAGAVYDIESGKVEFLHDL